MAKINCKIEKFLIFSYAKQNLFDTKIKNDIRDGKYFAFTGPLKDNTGKLQLKDGEVASDAHLNSMMYYVEGIDAKVPVGK